MSRLVLLIVLILCLYCHNYLYAKSVVLCYHKVGYSIDDIYSILPEMLEEQIRQIRSFGIDIVGIDYFTNSYSFTNYSVSLTFDDGWRLPRSVISFFKKEGIKTTFFIYPSVIGGRGFFSWNELKELSENGFIIGSHGYSHIFLKGLSNSVLYREVVMSKEYIQKKLGTEVFALAYPFGVADTKSYTVASKTYKLSFIVEDQPIRDLRKTYRLPRYIVFNHTTLGQFREILDSLYDVSNLDYKFYRISSVVEGSSAKLYHFPVDYPEMSVVVIPSLSVGVSWFLPMIDRLREFNIDVWVFYSEVYGFPFYKYEVYYESILELSADAISLSLSKAISIIPSKRLVAITWGDGFDLLVYSILTRGLQERISKIISINPSLVGGTDLKTLQANVLLYKKLLSEKKYDFDNIREGIRTSVLLNLASLRPLSKTPFKKLFGERNNLEVLLYNLSENVNLRLNSLGMTNFIEIIQKIQMSPFYPFAFVQPIPYLLGINEFWLRVSKVSNNFSEVFVFYNEMFEKNFDKITNVFGGEGEKVNLSTVEIFVSDDVSRKILSLVKKSSSEDDSLTTPKDYEQQTNILVDRK
ncbi:MAG: polysaccharide deacetylase family protein [Spirochaetes bacterium]|nr:polysaccharide deacetylase family protein [Spirochaetota bacterium]